MLEVEGGTREADTGLAGQGRTARHTLPRERMCLIMATSNAFVFAVVQGAALPVSSQPMLRTLSGNRPAISVRTWPAAQGDVRRLGHLRRAIRRHPSAPSSTCRALVAASYPSPRCNSATVQQCDGATARRRDGPWQ